ncbi:MULTISPECIES: YbaK/EbsC family protein [Caproicibacterium]|uniref:YbaK/EbsC family protein n=1 Tax=Caproicibacterium argilliputei TaxID=3030016 RepID=A0AA97D725_9FIRM|nr:YbaK/EbsC family protein [Caproicibacterium argilliputei]WOC31451.1 YbaK/EbsC family protein [Caproicibacterium argilliputei]
MAPELKKVKEYLADCGLADRVLELQEVSATVEQAAHALHVEPACIAKTISFYREGGCLLIVAAGDCKIDNAKFKRTFGKKAKMLAGEDVQPMTGYPIGGVCPFANPAQAQVWLDESLHRFADVYPAAGTTSSAVRLTCAELEKVAHSCGWVDVCKPVRQEGVEAT